jgi:hypothetical protein
VLYAFDDERVDPELAAMSATNPNRQQGYCPSRATPEVLEHVPQSIFCSVGQFKNDHVAKIFAVGDSSPDFQTEPEETMLVERHRCSHACPATIGFYFQSAVQFVQSLAHSSQADPGFCT